MWELQLTDTAAGLDEVFEDIAALAKDGRFSDCAHEAEPACAVRAAVAAGTLPPERLARWHKLAAEEAFNTETLAERRTRDRAFGKMVRSTLKERER